MKKIGFVGLGVMGMGMASNLIRKSNQAIYGYDPVEAACHTFMNKGGIIAQDVKKLYAECGIIFICLPTNDIVRSTVAEIIANARKGTIVVDMGSTSPYVIEELGQEMIEHEMYLLDSPVSGGESGAFAGELVIMAGGDSHIFNEVLPYLKMMGKNVTYMGASGCGSTAKIANNIMVGIHLLAVGEAYTFAKKAGISPGILFQAIQGGSAQSAVMDTKVPKILERDFSASARIAVHLKDINNACEVADHLQIELPVTKIVKEQMDWMKAHDMINEDQCALIKYYENIMGTEVK